jgi:hypothetical protein
MRVIQFLYAAIFSLILLPFVMFRDIVRYTPIPSRQYPWRKESFTTWWRGSIQVPVACYQGLKLFFTEYHIMKQRFHWSPLRYVVHTGSFCDQVYCRVLYGNACFWDGGARGPGYIGGYAIVLTGCLDGWKLQGHGRQIYKGWRWWKAIIFGRA